MNVAVDSNVILSFLTERDPAQQIAAERLFLDAAVGMTHILIPQFVMFEVAHVMRSRYGASPDVVRNLLINTLSLPGCEIADHLLWGRVMDLWPDRIPHFTDATMAAFAIENSCTVATFDKFIRQLRKLDVEGLKPE